jgi:hypothetical protein
MIMVKGSQMGFIHPGIQIMVTGSQMGFVHPGIQIQILRILKEKPNLRVLLLMLIFREIYLGLVFRGS